MSEKARALGIPDADLKRVLILVRNLRIQVIKEGLDPRATRIALIYANMADLHFAKKRLTEGELRVLADIAREFFDQVRRRT